MFYEYFQTMPRYRDRIPAGKLRAAVIGWALVGGLIVLFVSARYPGIGLVDIVTPAGIYTGVLACGLYSLANPWADRRFLPRSLGLPRPLALGNALAGVVFLLVGVKALWDYKGFAAFGTLALLVIASVVLAAALRSAYREPDAG